MMIEQTINNPEQEDVPITNRSIQPTDETKEVVTLEYRDMKISLGSCSRPVEYLAELLIELRNKLIESSQDKKENSYLG